jgi:sugar (pentulose or hexulose) kinase
MNKIPAIVVFDIGKTNKKLILFNEQYKVIYEQSSQLAETKDEDGYACEDINALTHWLKKSFKDILKDERFFVKAVNVSAYGASFVYLDENGNVVLPLYNYLKPYPANLLQKFYRDHGQKKVITKDTASPSFGSLNSGLQLYRIKYEKPLIFNKIKYALHLPQYVSYVLSGEKNAEITSIGCHTYLWDFKNKNYHTWVHEEGIDEKFPSIKSNKEVAGYAENEIPVGVGLHDSSAALIPYLFSFGEPFVLLSTGTWNISLNPFNHTPLNDIELQNDCLCYLSYDATPIKASRFFAGHEHEQAIKKLSRYYDKADDYYKGICYDPKLILQKKKWNDFRFFTSYEEAYHQFISDLVLKQVASTKIVMEATDVKRIFVDGGFSNNPVFMQMLVLELPGVEIYAASIPQASALGAALCFHNHWNRNALPSNLIELKRYSSQRSNHKE